ncbi:MAG TPA: transglycosylase domain-containing protein [Candidatus Saccharimonadales bacterium]|nr:transglycosylase domain-containing protein [Candidatus Saccharimonadales bacterium]
MNGPSRDSTGRRRPGRRSYTTTSGKTIRINQSLNDRMHARKQARDARKAAYLSTLPKNPFLRILYRMHPKRVLRYWFSREGLIMGLKITGIGIVVVFIATIGVFAYFRKDLPKIKDISGDNLGGSITYYDSTGKTVLWQDYDAVKRIPVPGDQISGYMKQATVAVEDKNFYHEGAFNFTGIARAATHDVFGGGGSLQGGSTITQQLVKLNEQWTDNRTITRKVKELILAVELSREYSKDDILTGYLNVAPYGGVEYGVEAAARDYFGTDAKDLTLAQAAMLAAIPQSPYYYSPYSSPVYNKDATTDAFAKDELLGRQQYILDQMVAQHMITAQQAKDAKAVDILAQVKPLQSKYNGIKAPYFVLAAKSELEQKYGSQTVQRGGWQVTTTLDMNLQTEAEKLVASNYSNIQYLTGGAADEEAVVAEDVQKGQIVALVGGVDFTKNQNNYAAGILIPPGSSFKPYDYTTFINNNTNVGAGSVLYDSQGPLPGYPCTDKNIPKHDPGANCLWDYDFLYPGPITLRYALGGSRNVPAVKAMLSAIPNDTSSGNVASINKTIATASAMMDNPYNPTTYNCYSDEALTKTTQCYGASAIGDGAFLYLDDHVNGLSTLARLGVAIPRTFILKITDSSNKNIYQWQQPQGKQVVNKDSAYILDNMASDPNASYLPGSCSATNCSGYKFHRYQGWHFAIKTGTTNNGFDGLMTSWSTKYAVVAWVGNHNRNKDLTAARGTSMEYLTEPLVKGFMQYAHNGVAPVNWQQPSDIKVLPAFVITNHIHYGDVEPSTSTDIYPSWYQAPSTSNASQTIDKVSGKAATSCTPDLAKNTQTNGNANTFSVDKFVSGALNPSTLSGTDDIHICGDQPPTTSVTVASTANPGTKDTCDPTCTITVTVSQGTHPLSGGSYTTAPAGSIVVTLDGQAINTQPIPADQSDVYSYSFQYTASNNTGGSLSVAGTDSVLYQGTATDKLTLVPTGTTTNNQGGPGGH